MAIKAAIKAKNIKHDKFFKTLTVDAFLKLSEYYVNEKNLVAAKNELTLGKELFPDNGYITMQLKMVEGQLSGGQ